MKLSNLICTEIKHGTSEMGIKFPKFLKAETSAFGWKEIISVITAVNQTSQSVSVVDDCFIFKISRHSF